MIVHADEAGMTVRPVRSMVFVPSGIFVVAASPIAAIFPSSINNV